MTDIEVLKENMDQSEFYGIMGMNVGKAFISVLLILGAFISVQYLLTLNNLFVGLTLGISIPSFVVLYIRFSGLPTLSEFFITDKISSEDNNLTLIKAQLASWTLALGVDVVAIVVITLLSNLWDPLSLAILKIAALATVATSFFVYTKREDIWTKNGFAYDTLFGYAVMGIGFGISTYLIGGIVVIASAFVGWGMTLLGIGLEVAFTSVYTYMDLQYWVNDYKRRQISKAEKEAQERIVQSETSGGIT